MIGYLKVRLQSLRFSAKLGAQVSGLVIQGPAGFNIEGLYKSI